MWRDIFKVSGLERASCELLVAGWSYSGFPDSSVGRLVAVGLFPLWVVIDLLYTFRGKCVCLFMCFHFSHIYTWINGCVMVPRSA